MGNSFPTKSGMLSPPVPVARRAWHGSECLHDIFFADGGDDRTEIVRTVGANSIPARRMEVLTARKQQGKVLESVPERDETAKDNKKGFRRR
jgi:hypothetical protein